MNCACSGILSSFVDSSLQDPVPTASLSCQLVWPTDSSVPHSVAGLTTSDTVHARLPAVHASAAGLSHGDVVTLQANLGSK